MRERGIACEAKAECERRRTNKTPIEHQLPPVTNPGGTRPPVSLSVKPTMLPRLPPRYASIWPSRLSLRLAARWRQRSRPVLGQGTPSPIANATIANCIGKRRVCSVTAFCALIFRSQYGGQRRVALFAEFINEAAAPPVGGLKDLGMPIEIEKTGSRQRRDGEHKIVWPGRQTVRILIHYEAALQNADRAGDLGQVAPACWRQQPAHKLPATRDVHIVDVEALHPAARTKMDDEIGAGLERYHGTERNVVDDPAIHQHAPIVGQ